MRSLNGLSVIDNCLSCKLREGRLFCDLPLEQVQELETLKFSSLYPRGAMLFVEGQTPRGVFVLCNTRVKLMTCSADGKTMIRIAGPGEVIGLSSVISGKPYEATAEILDSGQVSFIRADDFLRYLRQHADVCLRIAQHLSNDYQAVNGQVRSLGLSTSAAEKLARLILGWCDETGKETEQGMRLKLSFTHEEIAQMIGASRETVTRLLGDFRQTEVIHLKGSNLVVRNRVALEAMVSA
jgi:CRP/FNR family cyclic AMP-dependent transcriptional regulator